MSYFFSAAGQQRLVQMAGSRLLCVFDFDGTLAPIVARPEQASVPAEVRSQLQQLTEVATVGILTGRSLADVQPRLGFTPHYIMGNHGIEGVPGWEDRSAAYADLSRQWRVQLSSLLLTQDDPGIQLEDKNFSLSVHYRLARDPVASARQLLDLFEHLQPAPRIMAGKCVFNLLPQGAADKGSALLQLMTATHAQGAIYVGDDVTDEDVFRLQRDDILSVRTEYEAYSAAGFFLTNQLEMPRLLDELRCAITDAKQNSPARPPIKFSMHHESDTNNPR